MPTYTASCLNNYCSPWLPLTARMMSMIVSGLAPAKWKTFLCITKVFHRHRPDSVRRDRT